MGEEGSGEDVVTGLAQAVVLAAAERSASREVTPTDDGVSSSEQYVLMRAGSLRAAVAVGDLSELLDLRGTLIRSLPNLAPPFVGLARRRGHLLAVADLGLLLGGGACTATGKARLAVLRCDDEAVGLVVDEVTAVVEAGSDELGSLAAGAWTDAGVVVRAAFEKDGQQYLLVCADGVWARLRELVPVREGGTWPRG